MGIREEEEKYLNTTLEVIDSEIKKSKEDLENAINLGRKLSFEDRLRGEHFNVNSKAGDATQNIENLERSRPVPYFGRIDVALDNFKSEKIYIGRSGIYSNDKKYVTDWRAPICSLYYDSQIGKTAYQVNGNLAEVNLLLKRQINIKNSELIDAVDTELVSNDDLLKPYLEANADNKMKTIIASIQKEQNDIIRMPANLNIIVQGVAGSGKTSVALHRIAYLMYEAGNNLSSNSFLILGPNDYFLNYVSYVLPDLDTYEVEEETLINFARTYIGEKFNIKPDESIEENSMTANIQLFKTSLEYEKLLENYMNKYFEEELVPEDFKILDQVIFSKKDIRTILFSLSPSHPDYTRADFVFGNQLKEEYEKIFDKISEKCKLLCKNLDVNDPKRKELMGYTRELHGILKTDGVKLFKKYLKNIQLSSQQIYAKFIDSLDNVECTLTDDEKKKLQQVTLNDLQKKKIGFEDLAPLLYISYRLTNKKTDYKQIVIDEAQDYGLFHFDVLKKINPQAHFTIYGDLAQAIYPYRSVGDWDELSKEVFNNDVVKKTLSKSYRTTIEITENANAILNHLNLGPAMPVIRHGEEVAFVEKNVPILKIEKIQQMLEKGYKTIAVICKDETEVKKVYKELEEYNLNSRIISSNDTNYDGGLFVLTGAASKGLEFDGVIINDVSTSTYDENSSVDMHLLYVACTRSLHELCAFYKGKIISLFEDKITKQENKQKTK